MIRTGLVAIWLCSLLTGAGAETSDFRISPKNVRDEVRTVVTAQLAALGKGDFATAYGYAAAGIKRQFDAGLFAAMIKRGYPALLRHEKADLGLVRDDGAGAAQVDVTVIDHLSRTTVYRYRLTQEKAGWRISGVLLEQKALRGDI